VLRELPVIVTGSLEGAEQVARCIELGADDFPHEPRSALPAAKSWPAQSAPVCALTAA